MDIVALVGFDPSSVVAAVSMRGNADLAEFEFRTTFDLADVKNCNRVMIRPPPARKRSLISRKMPSRCIFFFSTLRAWSTLLSRTKTCTRRSSSIQRLKAPAFQEGPGVPRAKA
jgi:hypothetical protein